MLDNRTLLNIRSARVYGASKSQIKAYLPEFKLKGNFANILGFDTKGKSGRPSKCAKFFGPIDKYGYLENLHINKEKLQGFFDYLDFCFGLDPNDYYKRDFHFDQYKAQIPEVKKHPYKTQKTLMKRFKTIFPKMIDEYLHSKVGTSVSDFLKPFIKFENSKSELKFALFNPWGKEAQEVAKKIDLSILTETGLQSLEKFVRDNPDKKFSIGLKLNPCYQADNNITPNDRVEALAGRKPFDYNKLISAIKAQDRSEISLLLQKLQQLPSERVREKLYILDELYTNDCLTTGSRINFEKTFTSIEDTEKPSNRIDDIWFYLDSFKNNPNLKVDFYIDTGYQNIRGGHI